MTPARLLEKLRKLCLSLPEASEVATWGHPNFRAGRRTFAAFEVYDGRPSVAFKAADPEGQMLVDEKRFFRSPYVGKYGWVSAWADGDIPWPLIEDRVLKSYRAVALKRMLAALDRASKE